MRRRSGLSVVEWCVVGAVIGLAVIGGAQFLAQRTDTQLGNVAAGVADPKQLKNMQGS
jgi:hypothetical protein